MVSLRRLSYSRLATPTPVEMPYLCHLLVHVCPHLPLDYKPMDWGRLAHCPQCLAHCLSAATTGGRLS